MRFSNRIARGEQKNTTTIIRYYSVPLDVSGGGIYVPRVLPRLPLEMVLFWQFNRSNLCL
jgi:hypothetical protein